MWFLGLKEKGRRCYWRLLAWTLVRRPRSFPISVTLAIYGYHFRRVAEEYIGTAMENTPGFRVTEEPGR